MTGNPFERLINPKLPREIVTADGRDRKGRFVNGPPPETKAKRLKTLTARTKGQAQTINMNFAGKINWLVRMLLGVTPTGYLQQLRDHPARKNLKYADELELQRFEKRIRDLQFTATELAQEIAAFNKRKKMKKMEDPTS